MACASTCPDQTCPNYGTCLRNKGIRVAGLESQGQDRTRQLKTDSEQAAYRAARAEGLSPQAPTMRAVDAAKRTADLSV